MENQDWQNEYKQMKTLTPSQLKLLEEGPVSLSQSWLINQMWTEWNEIKKSKPTHLPQLSSHGINKLDDPWFD